MMAGGITISMGALWAAVFLPTHLVLRKIFAAPATRPARPGRIGAANR
jgi:hypothetical protein